MTLREDLEAPFSPDEIKFRVGATTKDKKSGLALFYADARVFMERLDNVCQSDGWQCRYSHAGDKVCCEVGLRIDGEWLWKADGAGDTQMEGDKGSFSDAFKRACVRWGVGRYLYSIEAKWWPLNQYGQFSQGDQIRNWMRSYLDLRGGPAKDETAALTAENIKAIEAELTRATTEAQVNAVWRKWKFMAEASPRPDYDNVLELCRERKTDVMRPAQEGYLTEGQRLAEEIKAAIDGAPDIGALNAVIRTKDMDTIKAESETAYKFLMDRAEQARGAMALAAG